MGLAYNYAKGYNWHPKYEDIKQACLLGLCEAALRWNSERGAFSTYAYYWMRCCIDPELRVGPVVQAIAAKDEGFEDRLVGMLHSSHMVGVLRRLIKELPKKQQHVILLKYPLDVHSRTYTDAEIARMLSCSTTWVQVLRGRALAKLRKGLAVLRIARKEV